MSCIKLFVVLTVVIQLTFGSKILIIHPMFTVSHWLTVKSLAESLVRNGHSVHVIKWKLDHPSPYEGEGVELHTNLSVTTLAMNNLEGRYFALSKEKEASFTFPDELVWKVGTQPSAFLFSPVWRDLFPFLASICETILSHTELTKELKSKGYDLALVDMIWNECSLAYVRHVLEIPITVGFWGISPETLQVGSTANFLASSYFPFPLTPVSQSGVIERFVRRMLQATHAVLSQLVMRIYFGYVDSVLKNHNVCSPHPFELQQDLDGVLINFEPKLEIGMRPLTPNFLPVGGLQIISKPNSTEIPTEISNFMNETDRVILFSLGATLNPERAPRDIIQTFFDAFNGFPNHRILFQFGRDHFNFSIPRNVKLAPWFPQQHILAHPKTVLFINHCGLQGVTEAVHFGVPLICMPVVTDAHETLHKILAHDIGLGLNLNTLNVEKIDGVMRQVLFNPVFKSNVDQLSELMRDVKETPVEKAIAFLEQLIRFKGTRRFSPSDMFDRLSIFEYFYLDILFVISVTILVGIYVTLTVFKQARLLVSKFKARETYRR